MTTQRSKRVDASDIVFALGGTLVVVGLLGFDWRLASVVAGLITCSLSALYARKR